MQNLIIKKNISFLKKIYRFTKRIFCLIFFTYKLEIQSIAYWCQKNYCKNRKIENDSKILIEQPKVYGDKPIDQIHTQSGYGLLPEVFLFEIPRCKVIGKTTLVISKNNKALYDDVACSPKKNYPSKSGYISVNQKGNLQIVPQKRRNMFIPEGVHLCHEYSYNYFHFIVECLPKIIEVRKYVEYRNFPVLIDETLSEQCLQALNIISDNYIKTIVLKDGYEYRVGNLVYLTNFSHYHDNLFHPINFNEDILVSPTAIKLIRNTVFEKVSLKEKNPFRKIFIKRISNNRKIINEDLLELYMKRLGYEIVQPECLSFLEQVKLFSESKVVVAQAGAAFTNIIFSPPGSKVFTITSNHKQYNLYFFQMLATILNLDLSWYLGSIIENQTGFGDFHSDFSIDIDKICPLIEKL